MRRRSFAAWMAALVLVTASALARAEPETPAPIPDRATTVLESLRDGRLQRALGEIVRRTGPDDPTPGGQRAMARVRARVYFETIERELGPIHAFRAATGRPDDRTWVGFSFREEVPPTADAHDAENERLDRFFVVDFAYAGELPVQISHTADSVTTVRVGFANDDEDARGLRRAVIRSLFDGAYDEGL